MKCRNCKKVITKDMEELEYSDEFTAIFCSPSCAMNYYFDQAGSIPVSYEEAEGLAITDKDFDEE